MTLKKFDVVRRDKSQPDVIFHGSEKRQQMILNSSNGGVALATKKKPQQQATKGRTLNNTVIIQGNQTHAVSGVSAT